MFAERIYQAISQSSLSYGEVAQKVGIPKTTLFRWATGETGKIPVEAIKVIADATGVSPSWIMGWSDDPHGDGQNAPTVAEDVVSFPVLGEIAAGYDYPAVEDWSGATVEIPASYLRGRDRSEFLVLEVHGDSMYPLYMDGDKVLVLRQASLDRSGQIGAVIYDGDAATLKKVEYVSGEDWMRLVPINPIYPPRTIRNADLELCRVIGVPVLLVRDIKE